MAIRKRISVAAALCAAFSFGQAQASFVFTDTTPTVTVNFEQLHAETSVLLKATITYTLLSHTGNEAVFKFDVQNTTADQTGDNRLVAFGINVVPLLTGATESSQHGSDVFNIYFKNDTSISNGYKVDFCGISNDPANNCTGGGGGGLTDTNKSIESFQAVLTFGSNPFSGGGGITFENFIVRFQSVGDGKSTAFSGDPVPPRGNVPIPSTLALLGIGLLGAGVMRRRSGLTG